MATLKVQASPYDGGGDLVEVLVLNSSGRSAGDLLLTPDEWETLRQIVFWGDRDNVVTIDAGALA